jgi:pSer/pThr/pTyr-binding forkhead associated (FHA) protein/Zn-dependent protease
MFDLVLPDGTRVPVIGDVTIGRAPDNTVRLADPTVSRHHARIRQSGDGEQPVVQDAGSSFGTFADGDPVRGIARVHDGARLRVGNQELVVERRRGEEEAGRTIVVPKEDSLALDAVNEDARLETASTRFGMRPRLHSGYALKRLEASEGPRRWVLKNLTEERIVRLSDTDAQLLELIDGRRSLPDLVRAAELQQGTGGPALLARLLAELGDRGFLAGANEPEPVIQEPRGFWQRLMATHAKVWPGAGDFFDRLYRGGAWRLITRPMLAAIASVALIGIFVFGFLVARRYGTPFVVASKVGLGGLVFVLGRLALVAAHETAHGLAMSSFGRRVRQAGVKVLMFFPYAFVDTSDMWFEPRRKRIAVSAAGPVSDFTLGGVFSLACLALPSGALRDIMFQLAFAAYVGGLFNLNPVIERDGYQILVDVLREPGLRRRAREQFKWRLSGRGGFEDSRVLARYSLFAFAWSLVAAAFAVAMSTRYHATLTALVPGPIAWSMLVSLWIALFIPAISTVFLPLWERARSWEP